MPTPFEPGTLGGMTLKNRFVRSATWEGMAGEDGSCSGRLVELTGTLADGEIGLIISSHAFVSPEGQASPRQLAVYDDAFVPGLRQMADAAHARDSRIVLQLAHAGIQSATSLTRQEAIGPSSSMKVDGKLALEMTRDQIDQTIESFASAAVRAKEAGFDGVQIHAAHGYLLSQFLSPHFNRRTDDYGGSLQNRSRIVLAITKRIKTVAGSEFTVLIKMNSEDFIDGGLTVEEMLQIARMLEEAGIDGIEMSGGTVDAASRYKPVRRGKVRSEDHEGYYREAARRYKATIGVPLLLVGGVRSYTVAEGLITDGVADYIALSRPLIREPHLVARWKSGDREKSACVSCNMCFKPILEGEGMYCVAKEKQRHKQKRRE